MKRSLAVFLIALTGVLAGCGMFGDKVDAQKNWTAEQFYRAAKEEFDAGNYQAAIKLFESLEAKFPFGRFAQLPTPTTRRAKRPRPSRRAIAS
jgi:DNA uptake lipoprotein